MEATMAAPITPTTEDEFVRAEIAVWGEDYIFDLIERGYSPQPYYADGRRVWRWVQAAQAA
jgi:hypothetical protein